MAELGNISERRVAQLIMGLRGLPEFLVANPGLNSGFMIPQYAAASMVSRQQRLHSIQQRTGRPCKYGSQRRHQALQSDGQPGTYTCHRIDERRTRTGFPPPAPQFTVY